MARIYDKQQRPYFYVALKSEGILINSTGNHQLLNTFFLVDFDNLQVLNFTQEDKFFMRLWDIPLAAIRRADQEIINI